MRLIIKILKLVLAWLHSKIRDTLAQQPLVSQYLLSKFFYFFTFRFSFTIFVLTIIAIISFSFSMQLFVVIIQQLILFFIITSIYFLFFSIIFFFFIGITNSLFIFLFILFFMFEYPNKFYLVYFQLKHQFLMQYLVLIKYLKQFDNLSQLQYEELYHHFYQLYLDRTVFIFISQRFYFHYFLASLIFILHIHLSFIQLLILNLYSITNQLFLYQYQDQRGESQNSKIDYMQLINQAKIHMLLPINQHQIHDIIIQIQFMDLFYFQQQSPWLNAFPALLSLYFLYFLEFVKQIIQNSLILQFIKQSNLIQIQYQVLYPLFLV